MRRRSKQVFIIFVYFLLFVLFFAGIFFAFFYQKPTCTDGRQNQDERGIDCGGRCSQYCLFELASRPLVIQEAEVLAYGTTSSDAIGKIRNQNEKAALKSATYIFTFYDSAGAIIAQDAGFVSLLPLEEKTVTLLGIPFPKEQIARTELTVSNEEWVAFTDFTEPPDVRIANPQFTLLSGGAGYAEARGLVQNRSPFDIRTLEIVVVVRDTNGQALSVNRTTMDTVLSGQQRDFRLIWPQSFPGTPATPEMEVHFNMLAEDALIERYFPLGEFQSLVPKKPGE